MWTYSDSLNGGPDSMDGALVNRLCLIDADLGIGVLYGHSAGSLHCNSHNSCVLFRG